MKNFARLAAVAAAAALVAAPAVAAPVAADPVAKAHAKIMKPLTLEGQRDLDFGIIVVGAITGPETVSVSNASTATRVCGSSGLLTCSGTPASAQYEVTGTNNAQIRVDTDPSDLTNQTSGGSETIQFTPTADFNLTLSSSSATNGDLFYLGGEITIDTTTVDGRYEGDIEVTVDYL